MVTASQPDPRSAALEMALQPNLASLDELLAAIRALQFQADQEIARLLEQNAELLAALDTLVTTHDALTGWMRKSDAPAIRAARVVIAKNKPNTRTDADVADDARAIREEAGR